MPARSALSRLPPTRHRCRTAARSASRRQPSTATSRSPASADLWLSSTATDTDLQVTVTEVRPDGQELYVQRGWLRASHRTLDEERSTPTRPFHTHAVADVTPLAAGVPTPVRVEVWPVNHVFRAGSALRMYVEAPVSVTGFRQLLLNPTPAVNTVHVGPETPSRLVLSVRPGATAPTPLPACDSVVNQPCRPNPSPAPSGGRR
ncbi:MAG: CocE/NonD family hydrolase C-terminal non-catalytic domain-containing protein [Actinomycetes bacterium]